MKDPGMTVVGKVKMAPLASVKPNGWNPNRMTPFERASLRRGLEEDGWLRSQSLLVWGTDETGKKQNLIIDGEQRWTVAMAMGFTEGPMVFLKGLAEATVKALTVKMDQKRGKFDRDKLTDVVRELAALEADREKLSLGLGIDSGELATMLGEPSSIIGKLESGQGVALKTVQLFFQPEDHDEFMSLAKTLAAEQQTSNVTDTVFQAVKRAFDASAASAPQQPV
jgi:hypothetical protein